MLHPTAFQRFLVQLLENVLDFSISPTKDVPEITLSLSAPLVPTAQLLPISARCIRQVPVTSFLKEFPPAIGFVQKSFHSGPANRNRFGCAYCCWSCMLHRIAIALARLASQLLARCACTSFAWCARNYTGAAYRNPSGCCCSLGCHYGNLPVSLWRS